MRTQDLAAAQRFRRRQLVTALRQGRRGDREDGPRALDRGLLAGVGVALVAALAAGAHGFLAGGPPKGWLDDGHVVVDADAGGRYLARGGRLHAVPNETSLLLLTHGGDPARVAVSHAQLRRAPVGTPLGDGAWPESPPRLVAPARLTACTDRQGSVEVVVGPTAGPGPLGDGALVASGDTVELLAGGLRHVLTEPQLVPALTYSPDQVVPAPRVWHDLFRPGSALSPLRPTPGPSGATPTTTLGAVLRDAETSQVYVVQADGLSLVRNRVSQLLLTGGEPLAVPHADVLGARAAPESGYADVPDALPVVPSATAPQVWLCTSTDRGGPADTATVPAPVDDVRVAGDLPIGAGLAPDHLGITAPAQGGVLLRSTTAGDALDDAHPDYVVADGRAFRVADPRVLSDLGYRPQDVLAVPPAWLSLLPQSADLREPS